MKKYGDVEKLEVLRGEEAQVLNTHMEKTGRYAVSDFDDTQKEQLQQDLEAARSRMEDEGGVNETSRTDKQGKQSSDRNS